MSEGEVNEPVTTTSCCCASCGTAEVDGNTLTECDGCDLVRYCSDECRIEHKSEQKEDCKKRAAELRDELLFKQPESTHMGDCPICALPLSIYLTKSSIYECCSKVICNGCRYANFKREMKMRLQASCPFCRESMNRTKEEFDKRHMKRLEANDPVSLCQEGRQQYNKGDYIRAFEYWKNAAGLGHADAHWRMALLYEQGLGVEEDEEKEVHHYEEAAIGGHPGARLYLGIYEYSNNNLDRAVKHWIIAATQGYDDSIKMLMKGFKEGYVEKEVLTAALRAHKAAVDATKSPQRKVAEEAMLKSGCVESQMS